MTNLLSCIEINPAAQPIGSVILLHGLGADGSDFVSIVSELKLTDHLPLRFIFPHAPLMPITINNGYVMRAWYDVLSFTIEEHADYSGIEESKKKLHELIQHEENRGIPAEKIILAGFSQGAVLALTTGLTYPKRLGGIMALSGYLPQKDLIMQNASQANRSIPVFLAHGTEDSVVPFSLGETAYHILINNHYSVDWHAYPMPHTVCEEELIDMAHWLSKLFS